MSRPLVRYSPSSKFLSLTLLAAGGALLSGWIGFDRPVSWIAAGLFGLSAAALAALTLRPIIEIHDGYLGIGKRRISWDDIQALDCTGWSAPLALRVTLVNGERFLLIYPGDADSSVNLLRDLRRYSRRAMIDGVPYHRFWGEPARTPQQQATSTNRASGNPASAEPPPKYRLLRPEDEEEVERLYQKLRSVGRSESKGGSSDA